jgi:hypothetical protein
MIPSSAPTAKHCNAITSQKNSGLSYLETNAKAHLYPHRSKAVEQLQRHQCECNHHNKYYRYHLHWRKTSDFKLMKDGQLVGYCEVKSLFDLESMENPPEGEMAVRKNLPFYRKLGQHVRGATR